LEARSDAIRRRFQVPCPTKYSDKEAVLNDQNTDTFDKSDFLAAMAAMKKEDTSWKNPLTE
jgi:hypothetical protein